MEARRNTRTHLFQLGVGIRILPSLCFGSFLFVKGAKGCPKCTPTSLCALAARFRPVKTRFTTR